MITLLEKFVSPFTSYHTHTRTFLFYLLYLLYFFLSPYLTLKENHMIATKISPCMCCKFTPSDGKTAKLPLKVKHLRRFLSSSLFFFWRGRGGWKPTVNNDHKCTTQAALEALFRPAGRFSSCARGLSPAIKQIGSRAEVNDFRCFVAFWALQLARCRQMSTKRWSTAGR